MYKITSPLSNASTKWSILSNIAQIFDALGFYLHVLSRLRYLFREFWSEQIDCDHSVPLNRCTDWLTFKYQLPSLTHLKNPRHFKSNDAVYLKMRGFCDSSEQAKWRQYHISFNTVYNKFIHKCYIQIISFLRIFK